MCVCARKSMLCKCIQLIPCIHELIIEYITEYTTSYLLQIQYSTRKLFVFFQAGVKN